jgi:hypothetical protein
MILEAKVQYAEVDDKFFSCLNAVVLDRGTPTREKYDVQIVGGWEGIEEMRGLRKQKVSQEELEQAAAQVPLPVEDQVLLLDVVKVKANQGFVKLVCRVAQAA